MTNDKCQMTNGNLFPSASYEVTHFKRARLCTSSTVFFCPRLSNPNACFLLDAFRHGKYVAVRERWGSLRQSSQMAAPVIWIHCVSVGETQAARPLVQGLKQRFPSLLIAISTITLTGQNLAREI